MLAEISCPPLRTDVRLNADGASVQVTGELDMATAPVLADRLTSLVENGSHEILVDLSDVTFMDTSGLQALFVASIRAMCAGGRLVLSRPSDPVRNVLRITGTIDRFTLRD